MPFSSEWLLLVSSLLVTSIVAGPVALRSPDINNFSATVERGLGISLGSYSLATTHVNDVLFDIGVAAADGTIGESLRLKVECVDCRTWGNAVVTMGDTQDNDNFIEDIEDFFKDPIDTIVETFTLDVKISFENVGGHFEFDIYASDTISYAFPIFTSSSPLGVAISPDVTFGFVLIVELVFSLTAEIDLQAGFEFVLPDGAFLAVDPLSGRIIDHGFTGGDVSNLPVTVTSGSATFKAALRVRVQAGTTLLLVGTGFDFELGVFANLIEYEANLTTTDECALSVTQSLDTNIGAYAHAVLQIDYSTMGVRPAVVTTLLEVPLPSLCITRASATKLPAFATVSPATLTSSSVASLPTPTRPVDAFVPTSPTSSSPPRGGIFISVPTFPLSPPYPSTTATPLQLPSNSTLTTKPSELTTSTVYTTTLFTITHCASAILNCPASLASELIVTSSTILYTTICPVGQTQPLVRPAITSPNSSPASSTAAQSTIIVSPISLTPCATPIVSTVYKPTFANPTYHVPAALSTAVPLPLSANFQNSTSQSNGTTFTTTNLAVAVTSLVNSPPAYPTSADSADGPAKVVSMASSLLVGTIIAYPTVASASVLPFTPGSAGAKKEEKLASALLLAGVVGVVLI